MLILGFLFSYVLGVILLLAINPAAALIGALPFTVPLIFGIPATIFLSVAALSATLVVGWVIRRDMANGQSVQWWWPLPACLLFLGAFFVSAEVASSVLMRAQAFSNNAECVHLHSFFRSVRELGGRDVEHGLYTKGGQTYLWSYRQLRFAPASYATSACPTTSSQLLSP